ncbi:MAG: NAD(P)H-dependent oxidoreductase [Acidobacteria bacterium]|nr:NAD(P)H-dependent oxidoreductase [Acidobacteriota bacterium]
MAFERDGIRIVLINGSARPGNYTGKALAVVADEFQKHEGVTVVTLEPGLLGLPLPGVDPGSEAARGFAEQVASATAVVLATPEYHGMFSSVIKLAIENMGFPSALRGKPVALLGVASGAIGAVKSLEALRGVVSHVGALALPLSISVANVQQVFDAEGRCLDQASERHIRRLATGMMEYVHGHICPAVTLERVLREGLTAV